MSKRERLTELIDGFVFGTQIAVNSIEWNSAKVKELADYLIANGVIVPPCKVGDTVYVIYNGYVTCAYVLSFYIDKDGGMFDLCIKTKEEYALGLKKVIDKNYTFSDIFLTREEAEKALKEKGEKR